MGFTGTGPANITRRWLSTASITLFIFCRAVLYEVVGLSTPSADVAIRRFRSLLCLEKDGNLYEKEPTSFKPQIR